MTQKPKATKKQNLLRTFFWMGFFLVVSVIGGCVGASKTQEDQPLPPPEHATPLAAKMILEGNQRFAEHRWTAAIGKYEEAIESQPKLAEAHYNLGLTLYRKGPVSASRTHFMEAANLAPGHPAIWNAPPFRKYGTVESPAPEVGSDDHYGHQH